MGKSNGVVFMVKKYLLAWPLKNFSDAVLAIGVRAVECYERIGYKKKIFNLPYNIRTDLFDRAGKQSEAYKLLTHKWKTNEEVILLSSGALIERKGMDVLVKAFQMLPNEINAKLIILGDGVARESLEQLRNGNKKIIFAGFKHKEVIPEYFKLADIFVFASRYDGWGLVINEAMAAGCAVISSAKVGAAADKIKHGFNGWIINSDDPNEWKEAMERLIADKALRCDLVANSRETSYELSSSFNAKRLYDILTGAE